MSNTNNRISVISAENTIDNVFAENGKMKKIGDLYEEVKYREGILDNRVSREDAAFEGLKKTIRRIKTLKKMYNKPITKGGGQNEDYKKDIESVNSIIEKLDFFKNEPAILSVFIQKESQYVNLFQISNDNAKMIPEYSRKYELYGHKQVSTKNDQDIKIEHATLVSTLKQQMEEVVNDMKEHFKEHIEYLDQLSKDISELNETVSKYISNKQIIDDFKKKSKDFFNEENNRLKNLKLSVKNLYDSISSASEILIKNEKQKNKPLFSKSGKYNITSGLLSSVIKDDNDNEFVVIKNNDNTYTLRDHPRYVFKEKNNYYVLISHGGDTIGYFVNDNSKNFEHIQNLKDYLELNLKKNIERRIERSENGDMLDDEEAIDNIDIDAPTSNNVDDIFEVLMKSHEEKRSKAKTIQQRLKIDMEFLEHIDNLGLDVDEIFKVTLVDKVTFILFMLILHIATFSLIEYLIENEHVTDLVSIMIIYSLVYLSLIVGIVMAINRLGYRMRIVLNYLNTDFNTFNIGVHFALVFVFTGIIVLLSNVIDVENIKDNDDIIGMLYRIEVITSIMFIFSSLFVFLL